MRLSMILPGALSAALGVAASLAYVPPVIAADAYCPGGPGRAVEHKVPAVLKPAVAKALSVGLNEIPDATYVRCVGAKTMVCTVGANLDCGKADTRRSLPGATAFCRQNPGSDIVPMAATGHDTIYEWRCVGRRAVAGKIASPVDARGYIAGNWQELH